MFEYIFCNYNTFWPTLVFCYGFLQDKACEEVEETMDKSSSEYETDEDWEMERKIQAAIIEKDKVKG